MERIRNTNSYINYENGEKQLYSYTSKVAMWDSKGIACIYKEFYKYSSTTSSHISEFFNTNSKQLAQDIKAGLIKLI